MNCAVPLMWEVWSAGFGAGGRGAGLAQNPEPGEVRVLVKAKKGPGQQVPGPDPGLRQRFCTTNRQHGTRL